MRGGIPAVLYPAFSPCRRPILSPTVRCLSEIWVMTMNNWMRLCAWLVLGFALLVSMGCYSFETSYSSTKRIPWSEDFQSTQLPKIDLTSDEVKIEGRGWTTSDKNSRPYFLVNFKAPKKALREVASGKYGEETRHIEAMRTVSLFGGDFSLGLYIIGDVLMGKLWLSPLVCIVDGFTQDL